MIRARLHYTIVHLLAFAAVAPSFASHDEMQADRALQRLHRVDPSTAASVRRNQVMEIPSQKLPVFFEGKGAAGLRDFYALLEEFYDPAVSEENIAEEPVELQKIKDAREKAAAALIAFLKKEQILSGLLPGETELKKFDKLAEILLLRGGPLSPLRTADGKIVPPYEPLYDALKKAIETANPSPGALRDTAVAPLDPAPLSPQRVPPGPLGPTTGTNPPGPLPDTSKAPVGDPPVSESVVPAPEGPKPPPKQDQIPAKNPDGATAPQPGQGAGATGGNPPGGGNPPVTTTPGQSMGGRGDDGSDPSDGFGNGNGNQQPPPMPPPSGQGPQYQKSQAKVEKVQVPTPEGAPTLKFADPTQEARVLDELRNIPRTDTAPPDIDDLLKNTAANGETLSQIIITGAEAMKSRAMTAPRQKLTRGVGTVPSRLQGGTAQVMGLGPRSRGPSSIERRTQANGESIVLRPRFRSNAALPQRGTRRTNR